MVIRASRSGYYRWKRQSQSKRQKDNENILMETRESCKNSQRAYGSPRITKDLQRQREQSVAKTGYPARMKLYMIVAKTIKKFKMFYNRTRRHSTLGFKSPVSFELEAMAV